MKHPFLLPTATLALLVSTLTTTTQAQSAARREDAKLREEQMLRTNEQLSLLLERLEKAEAQITELQSRINTLQQAQQSTETRLTQLDSRVTREKDALLDEVANILAESTQQNTNPPPTLRQPTPGGARPSSQNPRQTAGENTTYYFVKRGDTLTSIARNLNAQGIAISASEIAAANNITDVTKIRVGQKLIIPKK